MVDPVRTGPISPVPAHAGGSGDVRRLTPQDFRKPAAPPTSASVPRLLDLVADLAQAGPPVDYARIAQIRRAIADGSYKIDADAVAKALVAHATKD
jgi:negative regulator of flagellin synthesis FlgM